MEYRTCYECDVDSYRVMLVHGLRSGRLDALVLVDEVGRKGGKEGRKVVLVDLRMCVYVWHREDWIARESLMLDAAARWTDLWRSPRLHVVHVLSGVGRPLLCSALLLLSE